MCPDCTTCCTLQPKTRVPASVAACSYCVIRYPFATRSSKRSNTTGGRESSRTQNALARYVRSRNPAALAPALRADLRCRSYAGHSVQPGSPGEIGRFRSPSAALLRATLGVARVSALKAAEKLWHKRQRQRYGGNSRGETAAP